MKAAIITPGRDVTEIIDHLEVLDPEFKPEVWPDITNPEEIAVALVWKTTGNILSKFTNLQLICSFGAGVDHLITSALIPKSVSITRLVDPLLSQSVSSYCLMSIIAYEKNFKDHILNTKKKKWQWKNDKHKPAVGILGIGVIGKTLASELSNLGYRVNGYSTTPKTIDKIVHFAGQENLQDFLLTSDLIINLLPLTPETTSFYNQDFFKMCKKGTYFINVGRGQHVVDEDLIDAIKRGHISGATLDVFHEEPLPDDHPFWVLKELIITPHIAGLTAPTSAASQFYENYKRLRDGQPLINQVDREKGY